MNTEAVFVYGTLRQGGSNHFRMEGSEFYGSGTIFGTIYRIDWYPALVCGGSGQVKGEFYRVRPEHLRALDAFEGISPDSEEPREYRRVKVEVTLATGTKESAWAWEWIGSLDSMEPLEGGDWLEHEPNPT